MLEISRDVPAELRRDKYVLFRGDELTVAPELTAAMKSFLDDWESLEPDAYLRGDVCFRRRRFALFDLDPRTGALRPRPAAAYFQSDEVNSYAGGVVRLFAPLSEEALGNAFLHALIRFDFDRLPLTAAERSVPWKVDVHQVRTIASDDAAGAPTPEGIHRDGEDFVGVHLVGLNNAIGGESTVYDDSRSPLFSCTLERPLDSMLLWDPHVLHGVEPIRPARSGEEATRDTILFGFVPGAEPDRPA